MGRLLDMMSSTYSFQLQIIIRLKLIPRLVQRRKNTCANHPLLNRRSLGNLCTH